MVSGWAELSPNHSRTGLELSRGTASQTTVRSMVAIPVIGGMDECGSSWICWQRGWNQVHMKTGLLLVQARTTVSSPATGAWGYLLKTVFLGLGLQQGFTTSYLNLKALKGTFVHEWLPNICFCGGTWAGNLLFCHHADVTPSSAYS